MTSGTTYPLTYDAKGNLSSGNIALTGSSAWGFSYDPENRLLNACKPYVSGSCSSPTVNATYAYDPLGRRTHKSGTGTTETFFLNDESGNEIAEYDGTGALTRRFVPGPGINDPVAMVTGTGTYTHTFYHTDHHGSVAVTARDNGNPMNGPFLYDPHGNCTISSSGAACTTLAATVQPFFFTGMYLDKETGLFFDRDRYYWSGGGRFMQTDAVGYTADLNLYTYVYNDPVNRVDPSGNEPGDCLGGWCPNSFGMWWSYDEQQGTTKGVEALPGVLLMTAARSAPVTGAILSAKDFYDNPSFLNGVALAASVVPGGSGAGLEFSSEKAALRAMADADFRRGITQADFEAYKELNATLSDPFDKRMFRGPDTHPNAPQESSRREHYHVAGVNHIPARKGSDGSLQVKNCIAGISATSHDPCRK